MKYFRLLVVTVTASIQTSTLPKRAVYTMMKFTVSPTRTYIKDDLTWTKIVELKF
jgi:hypothetical protein